MNIFCRPNFITVQEKNSLSPRIRTKILRDFPKISAIYKKSDFCRFPTRKIPEIGMFFAVNLVALQSNFIKITLWHGCSIVNLLHIFRTPFLTNTSGWLLLSILELNPKQNKQTPEILHKKVILKNLAISTGNGIPEFLVSGRKSWTLDSGRWTLDSGHWTLDSGRWPLDADFKDGPDIMLSEQACFSETKRKFNYSTNQKQG